MGSREGYKIVEKINVSQIDVDHASAEKALAFGRTLKIDDYHILYVPSAFQDYARIKFLYESMGKTSIELQTRGKYEHRKFFPYVLDFTQTPNTNLIKFLRNVYGFKHMDAAVLNSLFKRELSIRFPEDEELLTPFS